MISRLYLVILNEGEAAAQNVNVTREKRSRGNLGRDGRGSAGEAFCFLPVDLTIDSSLFHSMSSERRRSALEDCSGIWAGLGFVLRGNGWE